jgi:hypothetical protein
MNQISDLIKHNYISISKGNSSNSACKNCSEAVFSKPQHLVNEGSFYRLAELHIINKGNVESCEIHGKEAVITYYNGDVITLRMV